MDHRLLAPGVALVVLAFVMAVPQGSALAGMKIRTADLCPTENAVNDNDLAVDESNALGTAAVVTDTRLHVTAWAVSLESLKASTTYTVRKASQAPGGGDPTDECSGQSFVYNMPDTNGDGDAFNNIGSDVPVTVGDFVWICRDGIAILSGDLEKGGKERNKPNRCR